MSQKEREIFGLGLHFILGPLAAVDQRGQMVLVGVASFVLFPFIGVYGRVNSVSNWIFRNSDAKDWTC